MTGAHPDRRSVLAGVVLAAAGRLAAGGAVLTCAPAVRAAPAAELWELWLDHDPAATRTLDHSPWEQFLAHYLRPGSDGVNRVAYGAVTAADRASLDRYLDGLQATRPASLARPEQYALWVNLYNAATLRLILRHYPLDSIMDLDLSPGWFSFGPWDAPLLEVAGQSLTLNDIEHRILRPIWQDPRTHYAVNCASMGCPNLLPAPFTATNREDLLNGNAAAYINHARGVAWLGRELTVSKIYDWFREDFGGRDRAILAHLRRHAAPDRAARLAGARRIDRYRYDWSLNDFKPQAAPEHHLPAR